MQVHDVTVIGAGPAGLAVARRLATKPLKTLVLERTEGLGQVWANHYEGLTLNTVARLSRLDGQDFPIDAGTWPCKDDVARYLTDLGKTLRATLHTGVRVRRLVYESAHRIWKIHAGHAEYAARNVVVATGSNHQPLFPDWVEQIRDHVPVVHSSQYRSPESFEGQDVLVVGGGNSGAEIACRVARTARSVVLSLREAPLVLPRQIGPVGFTYLGLALRHVPAAPRAQILRAIQRFCLGSHEQYGLPLPSYRYLMNGGKDKAPTFYPDFLHHVRQGKVQIRGGVMAVDRRTAHLKSHIYSNDMEARQLDSVICATGFSSRPDIDIEQDSRVMSDPTWENIQAGNLNPLPGLYALGFVSPISGQLREINKESKRIAARLT